MDFFYYQQKKDQSLTFTEINEKMMEPSSIKSLVIDVSPMLSPNMIPCCQSQYL